MGRRSDSGGVVRAARLRGPLLERGLAERSARVYQDELCRIEAWCDANGTTLATLTAGDIVTYRRTRPDTWSTRALMKAALSHYWAIVGRTTVPDAVLRLPKRPRWRCRAMEPEDVRRLVTAALERRDAKGACVVIGLYSALRRAEIAALRWDAFTGDGWLHVKGKGGVEADVPTHPMVIEALTWLPRRGEWVFPGLRAGAPIVPATVWDWVRTVARDAGLATIAPHVLRHTALATANDNTGDLRSTQAFARHAKPETTALYTRATSKRLKAVVASLDYLKEVAEEC